MNNSPLNSMVISGLEVVRFADVRRGTKNGEERLTRTFPERSQFGEERIHSDFSGCDCSEEEDEEGEVAWWSCVEVMLSAPL